MCCRPDHIVNLETSPGLRRLPACLWALHRFALRKVCINPQQQGWETMGAGEWGWGMNAWGMGIWGMGAGGGGMGCMAAHAHICRLLQSACAMFSLRSQPPELVPATACRHVQLPSHWRCTGSPGQAA